MRVWSEEGTKSSALDMKGGGGVPTRQPSDEVAQGDQWRHLHPMKLSDHRHDMQADN